jgi:hypothetical protein
MKRLFVVCSLAAGLLLVAPAPEAAAWSWGWSSSNDGGTQSVRRHRAPRSPRRGVPELDPSAAGSAMVLLLGGVAYIASRRRKDSLI